MALQNLLGELSLEASQQELLAQATYYLAAILDKLPRIDNNDRVIVNTSDQGNVTVALAAAQTLGTVTTVSTVSALSNQTSLGGRDMSHAQMMQANAGCMHIYHNILVSA
jgi:hypothetical protein